MKYANGFVACCIVMVILLVLVNTCEAFTHVYMIFRTMMTKSKDTFCFWGLLSTLCILQLNKISIEKASKAIKSCQLSNLYVIHAYFAI